MTIPDEIKTIMKVFIDANHQIYIIGGAVRELLMGREPKEWDLTTDAKPEEIQKLFPDSFSNNKFGTVGVPVDVIGILEITTMRKEGEYKDYRHPEQVMWTKKIEEDLSRRDFTINSIAMGIDCRLVDPFDGQKDLKIKLIRAVGDPNQRFNEDALRLMRAIRIATQINFEIDPKTLEAIHHNSHLIKEVASERVRDELFKLLSSDHSYEGVLKLREVGILEIILPEIERCFGVKQTGDKKARHYDVGEHLLESLKECPSSDHLVRLACLLHDIGKVDTFKETGDGNVTFYQHDIVGARMSLDISKRFNLSKHQTDKLYRLVRWHLFTVDDKQTDAAIRRFIKNVSVESVDDMMDLRVADRLGGGTQKAVSWRMEEFRKRIDQVLTKPFSISDLKISGKDVMDTLKIAPGPKVGEVLKKLFEEILEDSSKNNREYLLNKVKHLG